MSISYPGIVHESTPLARKISDMEVEGKFLGPTWKLVRVTKVPYPQPHDSEKDRGIASGECRCG